MNDFVLKQTGLDMGVPRARIAKLENPQFKTVGDGLVAADGDGEVRDKSRHANDVRQFGALIDGISDVKADVSQWRKRRHPLFPEIVGVDLGIKEAADLLATDYPGWSGLSSTDQGAIASRLAYHTDSQLEPPAALDATAMTESTSRCALACIVTGQLDYNNPSNLLLSGDGPDAALRPIDFGLSMPTLLDAQKCFDHEQTPGVAPNPWGAWSKLPWADQPLSNDVVTAIQDLDPDALFEASKRTCERVDETLGKGEVSPYNPETLELQRLNIRLVKEATVLATGLGLTLTASELHKLYYTAPQAPKSPYVMMVDHLVSLQAPNTVLGRADYDAAFTTKAMPELQRIINVLSETRQTAATAAQVEAQRIATERQQIIQDAPALVTRKINETQQDIQRVIDELSDWPAGMDTLASDPTMVALLTVPATAVSLKNLSLLFSKIPEPSALRPTRKLQRDVAKLLVLLGKDKTANPLEVATIKPLLDSIQPLIDTSKAKLGAIITNLEAAPRPVDTSDAFVKSADQLLTGLKALHKALV